MINFEYFFYQFHTAELEYPFQDDEQIAKKFAYQATFADEEFNKYGFQCFGEFFLGKS
jgi:hypothetical protein